MYRVHRHSHPPKPNLSKEEWKALRQLKSDKNCIILTADKVVALVVMDRQAYIKKVKILLEDTNTYRPIPTYPTNQQKTKLINISKRNRNRMEETTYEMMYPTGTSSPKFYGLPKICKKDIPLRSAVSTRGSVTYAVAKELARILKPLAGRTIHHVHNTMEFADEIKNSSLEERECITSYDVSFFIHINPRLEQDTELPQRTIMSANHMIELLGFCVLNTFFLFQDQFFEQTKGAVMRSPVTPIVANLFMEAFEHRAINTAVNPPRI